MWLFREGKSSIPHRDFHYILKIGRFRKVPPKRCQKTSKSIPKLVHNSKSALKRESKERVGNWSIKKLTFWVQKWSGDPLVKLMCDFEVPKGGPKSDQNVKKLIFRWPGGGTRKCDEKLMKMWSFWQGESSKYHWFLYVFWKSAVSEKYPQNDAKRPPKSSQIGPKFEKWLKKRGPKKGSKTGAPKSYF